MTSLYACTLQSGAACTLYAVGTPGGESEARNFLASLDQIPQVQFQARFERLTAIGYLRSPDEMRELHIAGQPPVHEIKTRSGYRLYVIRKGSNWIATHGAKKPKDKQVGKQVQRARDIYGKAGAK